MNRKTRALWLGMVILGTTTGVGMAQEATEPAADTLFSGELAYEHVAAQVAIGSRATATAGNIEAGNLILGQLQALGWETEEDWHLLDFGPRSEFDEAALQTFEDWQPLELGTLLEEPIESLNTEGYQPEFDSVVVPVRNLVASYGEGPVIIIGAHYDSRIYADHDPDEANHREPLVGANDGASGVGVLLEMARVISENYDANVEIRFVFFDAEDNGRIAPFPTLPGAVAGGYIVGSTMYAAELNPAEDNIQYMLLLDLVGEADQQFPIESYSAQYGNNIAAEIWQTAADLGYAEQFPTEVRSPIVDDHVPFIQQGIPAVDIIDLQYEHWHTTADTLDQIDPDSLERVGRVVIAYLEQTGAITPKN